ncbi:enoyl-CoA hydratase/isomerase family protein [Xanthobacter flavus]|uniref:enoyl-CoA hydratase/isomerase family protein n=1 Tax=Xanthobacter flavus TaxID=281 RepID=UPI00372CBF2E
MVNLTRDGDLAVITLDRPEALNALSFAIIRDIGAAIDEAGTWDIRALIFTGAGGKAFCAGADIKELMGRPLMAERAGAELGQRTFARLDGFKVPSLAAINGYAFGGGLELAMACTFRVASPKAKMGLPEIKLGLIPGYGGTQRLPRLVGEARALEMVLTGRTVGADEALAMGLVNRLAEGEVLDLAKAFAAEFTGFGLPALSFARDAVQRALGTPLAEGLRIEADLSTLAYRTQDAAEGLAAFVEKRKPTFEDR